MSHQLAASLGFCNCARSSVLEEAAMPENMTPKLRNTLFGLSQYFEGGTLIGISEDELIERALKAGVARVALGAVPAATPIDPLGDQSFRGPDEIARAHP